MPILLCPLAAHAHEDEALTLPSPQDRLSVSARLDLRHLQAEAPTSAALPLAGIAPLRQPQWLWGGSGLALSGQKNLTPTAQVQTTLSVTYSDQEKKFLLDEGWLGLRAPQGQLRIGRMDPLPVLQPEPWPTANLLMQGLLGDDHWHGDGVQVGQGQTSDPVHWRLGAFRARTYPGAQDTVWSLGSTVQLQPRWQVSAALLAVPQLLRPSLAAGAHTHSTATDQCGRALACVDGQGGVLWLASQWQDQTVQPHWRVNAHLMLRQEEGQVLSHNGRADYRGQVWGSLVELGYRLRPDWQLALRHERLAIDHELHGANVQLIAQDAGLLDNTHSPQRLGAKLSWQVRPGWTLHGSVLRDHSRAEAQWLSTLGLTWRPEGWRVK